MTEQELVKIEEIANTMRGMTMDMRIPIEARAILVSMANDLDAITEAELADDADELDPDLLREDRDERARLAREDDA